VKAGVADVDPVTDGELGAYLRRLRAKAGLTQVELASRMSCSQSKIQKIETGQNRLTEIGRAHV
jgi:transcriptional regulator with XRE-family HTH domain